MDEELTISEILFIVHLVGGKHEIFKLEGDEANSDKCRDIAIKLLTMVEKIQTSDTLMRGPNQMGV